MIKSISSLDFKLGFRMLLKYRWLTLVGGLGMSVAVAIGASFFGVIYSMMDPKLPLPNGDRLIAIQLWERAGYYSPERRVARDFFFYRGQFKTIEDLGIWRTLSRNLVTPHGTPESVPVAEMTASGFRAAGTQPVKGRYFTDADENNNAPPVVVIGESIWKERFGGDPHILKRKLQLGDASHQIIGVMPEEYHWPMNFSVWVPMRAAPTDYEPAKGPAFHMFARLARGETLETAQAELTRIGKAASAAFPATHAKLSPTLVPYAYPFFDIDTIQMTWAYHVLQMCVTLLLVLVCANVATLMYARTATRHAEIVVRTALGAGRWRIVGQLFTEALVLATFSSIVGITIAKAVLQQIDVLMQLVTNGGLPFWLDVDVSLGVIAYVVGLTLLAAMIIGAVPAIKATGKGVQAQLRQLGGGSGPLLGRTWTILIVAQVAFAVTILPATLYYSWEFARYGLTGPGIPAEEYLMATLGMERPTPTSAEADSFYRASGYRFTQRQSQLMQRLRAEPGVVGATFLQDEPGQEGTAMIEVEGLPLPNDSVDYWLVAGSRLGYAVRPNRIDTDFFEVFDVRTIAGRTFARTETDSTVTTAVVNRAFVQNILGGQSAVGKRFRYVGRGGDTDSINVPLGKWFQIAGVVTDFPQNTTDDGTRSSRVYHPPLPGQLYQTTFVRFGGPEVAAFVPRLKAMTASLDPTLQIRNAKPFNEYLEQETRFMRIASIALITLTLSVLLLSAAGIYSLMSLTVNQRRREIGIRAALGAYPRNILMSIFRRSARQLVIGVLIGVVAAYVLDRVMQNELLQGQHVVLLPAVSALMITVGLLAAWGPARRGLAIQPTEALRDL